MLKKMQRRFIGAAMAAFTAVILMLFCVVNAGNYRSVASQQDDTLARLLAQSERSTENDSETPPEKPDAETGASHPDGVAVPRIDGGKNFSPEVPYMFRYFSVRYDAGGTPVQVDQDFIASISRDEAEEYAADVLASGRTHGYYKGYRYLVAGTDGGTSVIFLNSERELHSIRALFWITAVVAGGCLVIVFLLVLLFSRRAIAPYMRNLAMQKQFITNASHELKTPLTAISTSADVLAMEYENDEWVKNIQSQSVRLSRLISDLVTLSRLDEENPFPERAEFSLSDAVWETAEPFTALARSRGRSYSQNIEDGLTMTGDRAAVQQMVSILLDNANKYTPENGIISLSARRAGRKNEITVSNTCEGAESIDVTRLFDRFYRADESHSTRIGGTGIGLSIARATAEAHGGTISAEVNGDTIAFRVKI